MSMETLSTKDKQILAFISEYLMQHNTAPTLDEIRLALGYKSVTSVQRSVISLENSGYLERSGTKRGLTLIRDMSETFQVPIVGAAACGQPILAVENIESYVPTDVSLLRGDKKTYFYLRAQGDSMNKAGIDDGDLVLVQQTAAANENDIVVALIEENATIKRFKRGDGYIALLPQSRNPKHQPIIMRDNFSIQGKVVKTVKL